ncbi:LytR family transcriptional regulator, partial [Streptococcus oralis]|nr:LytR family transcriptional regulator [Streptococcus oralis]
MSKENPLSHHEQLRYDYLFKNIHYLNDRERREFDYLQQKMAGPKSEVHHFHQEEKEETWGRDIDLPTYGSRSRSKKREKVAPQPKV